LNCAFGVFFTGQQGLDIVVTLGHNLGKDLAGVVSGVGCLVKNTIMKEFVEHQHLVKPYLVYSMP
jgi:hypothetical protein